MVLRVMCNIKNIQNMNYVFLAQAILAQAILAQGTAFLRKRIPSQSCAAMVPSYKCQLSDAEALMFALHRKLLSAGSGKANRHFQGVRQVERHFRAALSPKSRRWLCNLDTAFGVMRHITQQFADSCLETFLNKIQVHDETVDLASFSSTAEAASELEGYISGDSSGKVSSKFGPPFESIEMQEEEFYHINVKDTAVQADMFSSGSWEVVDLTGNDIVDGFKFVVMQALNNVEACQGRVSNLIGPNVLASSSPYDGVWEPFLPSLGVHVPPVEAVGIDASLVHVKAIVDSLLVVRTEANMVQEKNPVQYFIEFEVDDSDMPYHLIKALSYIPLVAICANADESIVEVWETARYSIHYRLSTILDDINDGHLVVEEGMYLHQDERVEKVIPMLISWETWQGYSSALEKDMSA